MLFRSVRTEVLENGEAVDALTTRCGFRSFHFDADTGFYELTVRFAEDGSFQYLGNEILNDGIMHIPDYQYRIKE